MASPWLARIRRRCPLRSTPCSDSMVTSVSARPPERLSRSSRVAEYVLDVVVGEEVPERVRRQS